MYGREFTVLVGDYLSISDGYRHKYMLFSANTKDNKYVILTIRIRQTESDDEDDGQYVAISNDGTEQDIDEILAATVIKVKEFHEETVNDQVYYQKHITREQYLDGFIGPLFIDKYELL